MTASTYVPPTRRAINLIVLGLVVGMFLAALDQMIVATAIRTIGDDLNGLTAQAWVTTAYMIAATLSTPLYGKLSDMFGRKPLYVVSLGLFVLGSLLCAVADSMYALAAYRFVQGLGAGGLMALALIILGDLLSARERTKYQAAFFGVWGVASVLGPVLGGFFAGADSLLGLDGWRWIFMINVPLGAAALTLILRVLTVPHPDRGTQRIDWWGVAALVAALAPLLTVLEQGNEWGWSSPLSVTLFAVAGAAAIAFVLIERAAGDHALLPLRMFRHRTVTVTSSVNFIMGFAMFGGLAGLPLYLQISRGMTPTEAGLAMLPFTAGIIMMATIATVIIRRTGHYKWIPVIGTALLFTGTVLLSRLQFDSPFADVFVGAIVFGSGLGCLMQPLMLAVQNALPARDNGAGTSSVMFFRQVGGSIGTAVFLSIMFATVNGDIAEAFEDKAQTVAFQEVLEDTATYENPVNVAILDVAQTGDLDAAEESGLSLDDTSFLEEADPVLAAPFKIGFASAIGNVMLMAAGFILLAFAIILLLPSIPLRETSGLEDMHNEAEARAAETRATQP